MPCIATRITRRTVLAGSAPVGAGVVLAACGATGGPDAVGGGSRTPQGDIRVAMYTFQPWLDAMAAMFGEFEQLHPKAKVTLETAPFAETFRKRAASTARPASTAAGRSSRCPARSSAPWRTTTGT